MEIILSPLLFALGVCCYAIKDLQSHSKLRGQKGDASFWGEESWKRKWKRSQHNKNAVTDQEAFWGSSRFFVFVTDGYHLMQFFYMKLFIASIVLYKPMVTWYWDGLIYMAIWYIRFNSIYRIFGRKPK